MREAFGVDVVDTHEHLLEVVSANCLIEGSRVRNIVKQFTTRDHLLDDVCDFNGGAVLLVHSCTLSEFKVLDDVLIIKLGGSLNFLPKKSEGTLVEMFVVIAEDLKGVLGSVLRGTDLDFGRETGAQGPTKSVSIERCGLSSYVLYHLYFNLCFI